MPTRRVREARRALPLALVAVAATTVLVAAGGGHGRSEPQRPAAPSWAGLVGGQRAKVSVGQRMLVVLRAPSLADKVAAAGGLASDAQQRRWSRSILTQQRLLLASLAVRGVIVSPEFRYSRVLNGFSAALDPRAVTQLERTPEVEGVYPIRVAYPAAVARELLATPTFAPGMGHRPDVGLPGFDGRGVTIALLDTGVDRAQPYLRGRVREGFDVVGGNPELLPRAKPHDGAELERHGTQMAGILVGAGGPAGLAGVAPGASVLPIRVAGWQTDVTGEQTVYTRTDQLIAGLERAVDPNGDGAAHDAARVALIPLAAPFAAFADDPAAKAVAGAMRLDTLVVVAVGNDGPAGPAYGSVGSPGGAPAALTVGAADTRLRVDRVRVVARVGLSVLLDRVVPLAGSVPPDGRVEAAVATLPRAPQADARAERRSTGTRDEDELRSRLRSLRTFFDKRGFSLVAGRAALVPASDDPAAAVRSAARAGASAVLLYGARLPAGALGLDEHAAIPVVAIPAATASALLEGVRAGREVAVSIGATRTVAHDARRTVAAFSSHGLAFDDRVKPELVAPGVGIATAEPGAAEDGSQRFGTVNGSSAAAAVVAGAAALLAQSRPDLDATALKGLLAGTARPLTRQELSAQGAGLVDVGAAAAGELVADPATLAFGRADRAGWRASERLVVRNVSTRPLRVAVAARRTTASSEVSVRAKPARLTLRPGERAEVQVTAEADSTLPSQGAVAGTVELRAGGQPTRVPWVVPLGPSIRTLLGKPRLSSESFKASDTRPAVLSIPVGRVLDVDGRVSVLPLARLELELFTAGEPDGAGRSLGLLARLRHLLPGRYAFGLTGRGPRGGRLAHGEYRLRLLAFPVDGGRPSRASVRFTIK